MTMSPIYGEAGRALPGLAAGSDSTLVGACLPRQSRLSARMVESSVSTIASSARGVETAFAAAHTAFLTTVLAVGRLRQRGERTTTSICTLFRGPRLRGRAEAGALLHPLSPPWPEASNPHRGAPAPRRSARPFAPPPP